MRLLHTSDWHLGQHFMGKSRQEEHQKFVNWLLQQVEEQQVDAILIAGDIFDTGAPPSYAREIYNQLIVSLHDAGTQLVVLAGNHDSVATLGESRQLLARLGAHVIPAMTDSLEDQLLVLKNRKGEPATLLCAVPFIRPRDIVQSEAGQSAEEKRLNLQQAIQEHYLKLHEYAITRQAQYPYPLPIITTGHLTTVGTSASESVREIFIGSLEALPTQNFPPADYIALGHIHRPQKVGGKEHIRYCGSPIPLSFDELGHDKEVLLVDLDYQGVNVTALRVPRFQPLASITGTLEELAAAIRKAAEQVEPGQTVWLEITVKADHYLADLQSRIQQMAAGLPVEILRIRKDRVTRLSTEAAVAATLAELTPDDVFSRRLAQEQLPDELVLEMKQRYQQIVAMVQQEQGMTP